MFELGCKRVRDCAHVSEAASDHVPAPVPKHAHAFKLASVLKYVSKHAHAFKLASVLKHVPELARVRVPVPVPNHAPERVPEFVPNHAPKHVPEFVPKHVPERFLEPLPKYPFQYCIERWRVYLCIHTNCNFFISE